MDKQFFYGFMGCLMLFCFIGATSQINNAFNDPASISSEFTNVYKALQPKTFTVLKTTPNISNMNEGEIIEVSTGTISLFTKVNGSTYSLTWGRN